jgi:hypothetical protein
VQYYQPEEQYFEDIDPIEPEFVEQRPRVVKNVRKTVKAVSPTRVAKVPVKTAIDQRSYTIPVKKTFELDDEQEFSQDDW